ncbi:MAG: sulfatase-like hydrolase/transferase [Ferruginibacter sp.]|nr:sulfatase-like hydrolase/transferase [Ferruginibacter sp.]
MQRLKKIPFFLLLLPLFFCLHGWLENYGFIRFTEILLPGLYIFAGIALLTGIVFLFTKNIVFASLIVFLFSLWYLFFGALHDLVKQTPMLSLIKSYPVIVTLLLLVTLAWIIFLRYQKKLHSKLTLYLNLLLFIYCAADIFLLAKASLVKTAEPVAAVTFDTAKVTGKPDVYLLLFDGYPGFTSLQDSFNFSNARLRTYLEERSFKSLPFFANYNLTYFCMSSMFNMQYVKDDFDNLRLQPRDFQKRGAEINHAAIWPVFKSMGYDIRNFSIFEVDDQPAVTNKNSFLLAHAALLTDKIFHNRLHRDVGGRIKLLSFWQRDFYQHDINNKLTEELLIKAARDKNSRPQFVYAHFMMPHGPYYFDSLGNKNPMGKIKDHTTWKDKPLFVSYLKYVNSRLFSMVDTIIAHHPQAIVIVMGDHGFRSYNSAAFHQPYRFDNLCMVRMPAQKQTELKNSLSTVNLFPYIFNSAFAQNMPYLADSSVVLNY